MKAKLLLFGACMLFSLLFFIFTMCSTDNGLSEGVVFKKEFRKADTGHRSEKRTQVRSRRGGNIVVESYESFWVQYPDRWVIFIHSEDGKDTADFYVHKQIYDNVEIGSHFKFDTIMGRYNEPYERIKK